MPGNITLSVVTGGSLPTVMLIYRSTLSLFHQLLLTSATALAHFHACIFKEEPIQMKELPSPREPHLLLAGGSPRQRAEEMPSWWRHGESVRSRSACTAGGDAALIPRRQRFLVI